MSAKKIFEFFHNLISPQHGAFFVIWHSGRLAVAYMQKDHEALNDILQPTMLLKTAQALSPKDIVGPIKVCLVVYNIYRHIETENHSRLVELREFCSDGINITPAEDGWSIMDFADFEALTEVTGLEEPFIIIDEEKLKQYIALQELTLREQSPLKWMLTNIYAKTSQLKAMIYATAEHFKDAYWPWPCATSPIDSDASNLTSSATTPETSNNILPNTAGGGGRTYAMSEHTSSKTASGGGGPSAGHSDTAQHQPVEPSEQFMHR